MASKIVVVGNVNGAIRDVFSKLAKLQVKQNFAFAIVVGDLFSEKPSEQESDETLALLQGTISVPLPTYFTVGKNQLPRRVVEKLEADDEVCSNLYYLGRRGTLKTSEGVRIVALGGKLNGDSSGEEGGVKDKYHARYTESDAKILRGVHTADILVTSDWPKSITTGSKVAIPEADSIPEGTQAVADVCSTLKPRYHLSSATDVFYEREPFFHLPSEETPDALPITRFINLAPHSKSSGQKWMYAFSLDPNTAPPVTPPAGATASPLVNLKRKGLESQKESFSRFAKTDDDYNRPQKRARRPPPGPGECFFCLSNPNIATHLITSIGTECYLTTAKGPLPTKQTFPELGFPGHTLIIPLAHAPAFELIADPVSRKSTYEEMHRYRSALHSMLRSKAKGKLGAVTWEVSRSHGIHIHWQFLPVPTDLASRGVVEAGFVVEAENLKYPKFEKPATPDGLEEKGDFFRVWIWYPEPEPTNDEVNNGSDGDQKTATAGKEKCMVLPITGDFRFDLQFGRRVMAKLLQLENRMHWKDDVQSQAEEEADADAFKEAFKPFDFSLEEG